jgi:hypothetical protein
VLFDKEGELFRAAGGGPDGSADLSFVVPPGESGDWRVEVDESISEPKPYAYDLSIVGASGLGPVNVNLNAA